MLSRQRTAIGLGIAAFVIVLLLLWGQFAKDGAARLEGEREEVPATNEMIDDQSMDEMFNTNPRSEVF